jgi:hypothetical protein
MKIKKSSLFAALTVVKPGLASKELLEQTTSFAFVNGRVVTYNDEISISHPVEGVDFEGAVNAKELYGLLSRVDKEEIEVVLEGTELRITAGRVKAGLKLETEVKLPLKEIPEEMEEIPNPEEFNHLLSFAMRTCSVDPAQPKLSCIAIRKNGTMVGSDGHRMLYARGTELNVNDFLLPASSAVEIVKIDPVMISLEKGWVHFANGDGTVVSSRRIEDDYIPEPQLQAILKFNKIGEIEFPARVNDILGRVKLFAEGDTPLDELVEIKVAGGKITFKGKSDVTGSWMEERATIEFDGEVDFYITPSLFTDILSKTTVAIVDKSLQRLMFSAENWDYVVMTRDRPEKAKEEPKEESNPKRKK